MPIISGGLVRLRPLEPDDLEQVYGWINDPEVTEGLAARYPFSRQAEMDYLARATTETSYQRLCLAIETQDEGAHIGIVSLVGANPEDRQAELGIMIGAKERWDHGYGTDAIIAILRFGFDEMNLHRVWLRVSADNRRAFACYRRCGFSEEGRLREAHYQHGVYGDVIVMGVLKDEFRRGLKSG